MSFRKYLVSIILIIPTQPLFAQESWRVQDPPLTTPWTSRVSPTNALPEYPRPQMFRSEWENLNGLWNYAITDSTVYRPNNFDGTILVPFPLESALSGVKGALLPTQKLWYQRNMEIKDYNAQMHYLLHFGAVDYQATIFVNGKEAGTHKGGYQEFTIDITKYIQSGSNELMVTVLDPTDQGDNPKGKQVLKPGGIMYTATSGIWQTVWLEIVPNIYITAITLIPDIDSKQLELCVNTNITKIKFEAKTNDGDKIVGTSGDTVKLPISNMHLWSPENPYLYDLTIRLQTNNKENDEIKSYFGMRKVSIQKDSLGQERIFLNNKYTFNLGVLDQGFWPDGIYTAPTDSALRWDIAAIKSLGFNMIRKHIKIEPARWYAWCDKLGMLVWQDMPYPANTSPEAKSEFESESETNIRQLFNYPSIVCWVLFNEGWNSYDQARLTTWVKTMDPTRLVDGHTGENYDRNTPRELSKKWINSDMTDIHNYPGPGIPPYQSSKVRTLGEWGGVRVEILGHEWNAQKGWGYIQSTPQEFERKYEFMIRHLKLFEEEGLSASVYTQPFDVEIEENGLITYDRKIFKIPISRLSTINKIIFNK
jgi:beta-galactosidase/beta-glucuronidase